MSDLNEQMQEWVNEQIFGDKDGYLEDDAHSISISVEDAFRFGLIETGVKVTTRYDRYEDCPSYAPVKHIRQRVINGNPKPFYILEIDETDVPLSYGGQIQDSMHGSDYLYILIDTPTEWLLYATLKSLVREIETLNESEYED